MGALLFADELLVHDFFELDHFGGCVVLKRYREGSAIGGWRKVVMGDGVLMGRAWLR